MAILAIDIGNTSVLVGCLEGEWIRFTSHFAADPNKTDNRGSTSWDFAINHYCDIITRVDDVTDIQKVEKELLDILFKYDADILNH